MVSISTNLSIFPNFISSLNYLLIYFCLLLSFTVIDSKVWDVVFLRICLCCPLPQMAVRLLLNCLLHHSERLLACQLASAVTVGSSDTTTDFSNEL